jgi:glycosyltransferase involved in cell wall biosynthesis
MALRTPVVATTKGAEGLAVRHGEHLLLGDAPEAFADAVLRVLTEPELCRRLTDNALRLIREKYDWDAVLPDFLHLVEGVVSPPGVARATG